MPLPDNIEFCCLALDGPSIDVEGVEVLLPGLTVSNSTAPIELDAVWEHWLGTIQAESFKESSLVIRAEQRSSDSGASEPVGLKLEQRVRLFHYALILEGCGYNSSALMVGGNISKGSLHIGPVSAG